VPQEKVALSKNSSNLLRCKPVQPVHQLKRTENKPGAVSFTELISGLSKSKADSLCELFYRFYGPVIIEKANFTGDKV